MLGDSKWKINLPSGENLQSAHRDPWRPVHCGAFLAHKADRSSHSLSVAAPHESGACQVAEIIMIVVFLAMLSACATIPQDNPEKRPFFQPEVNADKHWRKSWFDRLVELDPGEIRVRVAKDYLEHAPASIAVLPFVDLGSGNLVVNKIAITRRTGAERDIWCWTQANRLRKMLIGFLAQREFVVLSPVVVDAILAEHGVNNGEKLRQVSLQDLRKWLGVNAVVYGSVNHYEAYYFGLFSAWHVTIEARMVATDSGETLVDARSARWWTQLMPAVDPLDIGINSSESLLNLRDVVLVRTEEEVCREIVARIPISRELEQRLVAHARAEESSSSALEALE